MDKADTKMAEKTRQNTQRFAFFQPLKVHKEEAAQARLQEAIRHGNPEELQKLLSEPKNHQAQDAPSDSPFQSALTLAQGSTTPDKYNILLILLNNIDSVNRLTGREDTISAVSDLIRKFNSVDLDSVMQLFINEKASSPPTLK